MEKNYSELNAQPVLEKVEALIAKLKEEKARFGGWYMKPRIWDVCEDLSIFDWWNDTISISQLEQMRAFLKTAIKLGYTGYACFKVGASGCANGMWVNTQPTTTGFSPDCAFIYRSFTPDYIEWALYDDNNECVAKGGARDIEKYIRNSEKKEA